MKTGNVPYRILLSAITAILLLLVSSVILYRQVVAGDLNDIILQSFAYFFFHFLVLIFLTGEIVGSIKRLKEAVVRNVYFYLSTLLLLALMIVPVYKIVNDDVLVFLVLLLSYLSTMFLYLKVQRFNKKQYRVYRETIVKTTVQRCFDLSRSIDFHKDSMRETKEIPVSGKTSGLIKLGEYVEWEATHLLVRQRLSSKITEMVKPHYFVDEMLKGAFKSFKHRHEFREISNDTVLMIDDFRYEVPLGFLGSMAYMIFLKRYVENIFETRSKAAKTALESDEWRQYLPQ